MKSALENFGSSQRKSAWDQWRDKAADGCRGRRTRDPQGAQSASRRRWSLMRDHFVACLGFAMLLSSILFVTLAVMFEGAIARAPRPRK